MKSLCGGSGKVVTASYLESGQQQSLSDPHSSGVFDDANVEDVSLVQGVVRLEERKGCRGIVGLVNLKRKKQS